MSECSVVVSYMLSETNAKALFLLSGTNLNGQITTTLQELGTSVFVPFVHCPERLSQLFHKLSLLLVFT